MDQGFQFNSFSLQVFVKLTSVFISGSMSYDFLSFKTWYTLDLSLHSCAFLARLHTKSYKLCLVVLAGLLALLFKVLDCLSLPRNLMPLPYHVGSLNDIHFQRQCQHQRYILASLASRCITLLWLILTSPLLSSVLIFPIRSLCWEIW